MGDWTSSTYILSQIFIIIGYGCMATTYLIKKRSVMLVAVISCNTLTGIGFSLLSAWVGVGMCGVAILRDTVSYLLDRKRKKEDKNKILKLDWLFLTLWTTAMILITAFTQNSFWDWFALFGSFTFQISIWQKNILVYKALGILVGIFWIVYNVNVENLFGVILEACLLVAVIVGLVLYILKLKKDKKKTV